MSNENDDLPGVVFHKKSSEVLGTNHRGHKRVKVVLEAEVHDEEVWRVAEEKLNGLKVYTVNDFKGEMLNALSDDYLALEREKKKVDAELARVKEENERMKSALGVLQFQIEG